MFRRYTQHYGLHNTICIVASLGTLLLSINVLLLWNFRAPLLPAHRAKVHDIKPSYGNTKRVHPIDTSMKDAETVFELLISGQTTDLHSAAEAYRQKRGRHPPPGFDVWFEYARKNNAVIVEELFDQIHRDMNPFWGVAAKRMRQFAMHFQDRISIRNGSVSMTDNDYRGTAKDRMDAWLDVVKSIEHLLPDMDMAMNIMDESRVIAPSEDIDKYMESEGQTRELLPSTQVLSNYSSSDTLNEEFEESPQIDWIGSGGDPYWDIARVGCAPQSPARYKAATTNFTGPPPLPLGYPSHSYHGYVKNWTYARNPCQQSYLQESHGTFIEPVSISTTHSLVPVFSESKLSMNNDILIPPAAYLSSSFASGDYSVKTQQDGDWSDKISGAIWRGVASGGRNKVENWTRFHRHRFVEMLNGSYVQSIERSADSAGQGQTFNLQSYSTYKLTATKYTDLGTWLNRVTDVGFTSLLCFPATPNDGKTCSYTSPYFSIAKKVQMSRQYNYKFLTDIDGNSFSGRYLAFLRSGSVPIKATIYSEWHDDRLVPWLHFVPMDNSFVDVYGILDHFLGAGDDAAKKIAEKGRNWAGRVLRKEDMHVYMLRLLLEYARLCDDDRQKLGFVGDLADAGEKTRPDTSESYTSQA
jgi:hypothetical protein